MPETFFKRTSVVLLAMVLMVVPASAGSLTIDIDYTYDTNNFFTNNPQAAVLLGDAASFYENLINANLTAIDPAAASTRDGGTDSWTAMTFNPANTSQTLDINNPTINANTIVVYVGGSSFSGSELGLGGFGGYIDGGVEQSPGVSAWLDTVQARGVAGALNSDTSLQTAYAPWGGSISFSTAGNWYFDPNLAGNNTIPNAQYDFYSVALHELGHVLGLGTANVWDNDIVNGNFTGANAVAVNGGNIALSPDLDHWAEGTMSDVYGTGTLGNATMTPALFNGQRNLVTELDVAGLQDVGWAIVPEPAVWPVAAAIVAGLHTLRRKKLVAVAL